MSDASTNQGYTPDEMMTVAASRLLTNDNVCFVGIGLPSAAANLARLTRGDILIVQTGNNRTEGHTSSPHSSHASQNPSFCRIRL